MKWYEILWVAVLGLLIYITVIANDISVTKKVEEALIKIEEQNQIINSQNNTINSQTEIILQLKKDCVIYQDIIMHAKKW